MPPKKPTQKPSSSSSSSSSSASSSSASASSKPTPSQTTAAAKPAPKAQQLTRNDDELSDEPQWAAADSDDDSEEEENSNSNKQKQAGHKRKREDEQIIQQSSDDEDDENDSGDDDDDKEATTTTPTTTPSPATATATSSTSSTSSTSTPINDGTEKRDARSFASKADWLKWKKQQKKIRKQLRRKQEEEDEAKSLLQPGEGVVSGPIELPKTIDIVGVLTLPQQARVLYAFWMRDLQERRIAGSTTQRVTQSAHELVATAQAELGAELTHKQMVDHAWLALACPPKKNHDRARHDIRKLGEMVTLLFGARMDEEVCGGIFEGVDLVAEAKAKIREGQNIPEEQLAAEEARRQKKLAPKYGKKTGQLIAPQGGRVGDHDGEWLKRKVFMRVNQMKKLMASRETRVKNGEDITADTTVVTGSPYLVVITPSALRAVQLSRQFKQFSMLTRVLKAFARHIPIAEQVNILQSDIRVVVGTPNRIEKLTQMGALKWDRVRFTIVDDLLDKKKFSLFTLAIIKTDFWMLFQSTLLPRLKEGQMKLCLM